MAGAVEETWDVAAGWLASAGVGIAAVSCRSYLPIFFGFLVTLAAVINMSGYAFGLWHDRTPFDELVHGYTAFAGMAAGGWLFLRRKSSPGGLTWKMAIVGAIIGIAWEIFEWSIGIIGDPWDTGVDLLMDVLGAILAAVLLRWSVIREREHEADSSPTA